MVHYLERKINSRMFNRANKQVNFYLERRFEEEKEKKSKKKLWVPTINKSLESKLVGFSSSQLDIEEPDDFLFYREDFNRVDHNSYKFITFLINDLVK